MLNMFHRPDCVVARVFAVKLDWPITRLAAIPFEKGGEYLRTRALYRSDTQRLPDESNATLWGPFSPVAVVAGVAVVKTDWPTTRLAAIPFEKVGEYRTTLLLPASATQRFPEESKAAVRGNVRPIADVATFIVVKTDWPITRLAGIPFENAAGTGPWADWTNG